MADIVQHPADVPVNRRRAGCIRSAMHTILTVVFRYKILERHTKRVAGLPLAVQSARRLSRSNPDLLERVCHTGNSMWIETGWYLLGQQAISKFRTKMSYISVASDRFVLCMKKLLVILETVCGLKRERIYDET